MKILSGFLSNKVHSAARRNPESFETNVVTTAFIAKETPRMALIVPSLSFHNGFEDLQWAPTLEKSRVINLLILYLLL